jgi:hypothetical protein
MLLRSLVAAVLAGSAAFAQASAARVARLDVNAISRPPIPPDRMELVTGAPLAVTNAEQRMAAVSLLSKAHELSNVRAQPYDLKTSFTASGGLASDGSWMLQDTSRARMYRWTANGPNYSAINLYPNAVANGLYGSRTSGVLPLRLIQARSAIFFAIPNIGTQASVRTAKGELNGAEQECVLLVIGAGNRSFTGGRNWEEAEYCMDSQSGLLTQYSPVPGLYVRYDYSAGLKFHNKSIANAFTISENEQIVLDAKTISVADPPPATDAMFSAAGLSPLGVGRAMNPGFNWPIVMNAPGQPMPASATDAAIQVVALHGNLTGDGQLTEIEIFASTDSSLNQTAIDRAADIARGRVPAQPGATQQSSHMFLTFEFITAAH